MRPRSEYGRRRRSRVPVEDQRLSPSQAETLALIIRRLDADGFAPSIRELGMRSANAGTLALRQLERKGYIRTEPGRARALRVLRRYAVVRLAGMP